MSRPMRDQQRAAHAYECVASVPDELRKDYKILVNDFGANVMRCGLCAALAFVQRKQGKEGEDDADSGRRPGNHRAEAAQRLLRHLAGAGLPGLQGTQDLAGDIRQRGAQEYMMITREVLALSLWLRRAVQALITESAPGGGGSAEAPHA